MWGFIIRAVIFLIGISAIISPFMLPIKKEQKANELPHHSRTRTRSKYSDRKQREIRPNPFNSNEFPYHSQTWTWSKYSGRKQQEDRLNRNKPSKTSLPFGCLIGPFVGILLIGLSFWMGSWKLYQCNFTQPDEIKFVGHITDPIETRPNNFLVILFLEDFEQGRAISYLGEYKRSKTGKDDGYFEITVDNIFEITRCDIDQDFLTINQHSYRKGFLWLKKVWYIWHYFNKIETGEKITIPIEEKGFSYTLVVLQNMDRLPDEIKEYKTYLIDGHIVADIPPPDPEEPSSWLILCAKVKLCNLPESTSSIATEFNAWISEYGEKEIREIKNDNIGNNVIDINNCSGSNAITSDNNRSWTYTHDLNFDLGVDAGINYGLLALKISPSLGFNRGQIETEDVNIHVDVPANQHKRYQITWEELWQHGVIIVEVAGTQFDVPFSAKTGVNSKVVTNDVACP